MNRALRHVALLACAATLAAQTPPAKTDPTPQAQAGLETAWEIAPVLEEISAYAKRLIPALDKVDVKAWAAKGASDTYAAQLESSRAQARALSDGALALARNPERLAASLEVLFRIQGLETMLASLQEGLRKYQGAEEAQQLAGLAAENGASRDRLQRYIVNLAGQREQELVVMDREAQRCRGILTAPSAPPARPTGRKK
jgi:hypothetical protein